MTSETPVPGDPTPSSGLCMYLQTCGIHLHRCAHAHTHTLLSKIKKLIKKKQLIGISKAYFWVWVWRCFQSWLNDKRNTCPDFGQQHPMSWSLRTKGKRRKPPEPHHSTCFLVGHKLTPCSELLAGPNPLTPWAEINKGCLCQVFLSQWQKEMNAGLETWLSQEGHLLYGHDNRCSNTQHPSTKPCMDAWARNCSIAETGGPWVLIVCLGKTARFLLRETPSQGNKTHSYRGSLKENISQRLMYLKTWFQSMVLFGEA